MFEHMEYAKLNPNTFEAFPFFVQKEISFERERERERISLCKSDFIIFFWQLHKWHLFIYLFIFDEA